MTKYFFVMKYSRFGVAASSTWTTCKMLALCEATWKITCALVKITFYLFLSDDIYTRCYIIFGLRYLNLTFRDVKGSILAFHASVKIFFVENAFVNLNKLKVYVTIVLKKHMSMYLNLSGGLKRDLNWCHFT